MSASPPSARGSARRWTWILAAAGLLVLIVWWAFHNPESHPVKHTSKASQLDTPSSSVASGRFQPGHPLHAPPHLGVGAPDDPKRLARLDRLKAKRLSMIEDAIDGMRFPPDSQPLSMDMIDLIQPYHRSEQPKPLVHPKRGEDFDPSTSPYFLLTGPTYAIGPGQPLIATLEVYKGRPKKGQPPQRLAVNEIRARLLRFGQPTFEPVADLQMNDQGHDGDQVPGDQIYTVAVMPSSIAGLNGFNGIVNLEVAFLVMEVGKPMRASLQFTITTAAPATFTQVRRERLTDKGLEINMGMQVAKPGYYFVQGLLFDADGKPIGFAVHRGNYEKGLQEVPLSFFGLLFRQAKAKSPYVFKTVTGTRLPTEQEPTKIEIPPWKGSYTTRSYRLDDFSDSEWQSEQKDKRLQALHDLADKNPDKKEVVAPPENPHAPAPSAAPAPQPTSSAPAKP